MIKQIIFKKNSSLTDELLIINFDEKINIIIGPKGGGKSTLFDLLATIKIGYISQNVLDALKDFSLEFVKAIKFNNETINANQLTKKSKKEMLEDFSNRDDVIFQDDPIKKNINNLEQIKKQKNEYVQSLIQRSPIISQLINKIRSFYNGMEQIYKLHQNNGINWTNTFQIKLINDNKTRLLGDLSYKNIEIMAKIKTEKINLNNIIDNSKTQKIVLEKFKQLNFDDIFNDDIFNENSVKGINSLIKKHDNLLNLLEKRNNFINKIEIMIMSFDKAYKFVIEEIKKNDFHGDGLKAYEKQAQNYFKNLAKDIVEQKSAFETLINKDVILNFDEELISSSLLSYKINSVVKIEQDSIIKILKVILPTPSSVNDISKWLLELIKKGEKEFNEKKITTCIAKFLIEDVKVFADGQDYDTMSLGQKSIYGIKYKFNSSINKILFLDQPEDNLDNYTIATSILNMILQKGQQVFIVTHNANIGILSNPKKVIVADLNNQAHPYLEDDLKNYHSKEPSSTHYLEGGIEFLEKRYLKIKGDK